MKTFLFIAFCLFLGFNCLAQTAEPQNTLKPVSIQELYLAKDDGKGAAGEATENFLSSDVPIHCVVLLDSIGKATVKMNFIAVNVKGVKPETKAFSVSYTTQSDQNRVNFTGRPDGRAWVPGNYRIDIFIDGKLAGNKTFMIEKASNQNSVQTNFTQPKPRISKKPRKN